MKSNKLLATGVLAMIGACTVQAHDDDRFQPVPQLQGVWKTQITIVDCVSGTKLAGPFPGFISFQAGGTISESGPALPNSTRGPGFGIWQRAGRNLFTETLTFQRFDPTGIYLGTQVIRAKAKVADDSQSYVGVGGTFEVKDQAGTTLATGCSNATAVRLK
jgi:hypothetical protein